MTRAPAKAPNVPWPPVKGDITIAGDVATGKKAKCARCRHNILEVESRNWRGELTGNFHWIHYEPQTACLGAKR